MLTEKYDIVDHLYLLAPSNAHSRLHESAQEEKICLNNIRNLTVYENK